MLSDPIVVTYNTVAKNLAVSSLIPEARSQVLGSRMYRTNDGEFVAKTTSSQQSDGRHRVEILLSRVVPDNDADPFTGSGVQLENSFGLIFVSDAYHSRTSVDIPLLRTALLAFVDSTIQSRLYSGEI